MIKQKDGIENPVVSAGIGLLPIIYACTTALNSLKFVGMLFVAILLSVLLYLLFKPIMIDNVRVPCYVLIIFGVEYFLDSFTSELFMNGYSSIADSITYLLVATIIIYIFENIKSTESFGRSFVVSTIMGLRYIICGFVVGVVREVLGKGSIFGFHFLGDGIKLFNGYVGAMAVICVYAVIYGLFVVSRRKKYLAYNSLTDRYCKYLEERYMEFIPYSSQPETLNVEGADAVGEAMPQVAGASEEDKSQGETPSKQQNQAEQSSAETPSEEGANENPAQEVAGGTKEKGGKK